VFPTALALAGGFFVLGYGSRGSRTSARWCIQQKDYFEALGRDGEDYR
jgi:hypothetical protein